MKVYVVIEYDYDYWEIKGVFSTKEFAKRYINAHVFQYDIDIEEHELQVPNRIDVAEYKLKIQNAVNHALPLFKESKSVSRPAITGDIIAVHEDIEKFVISFEYVWGYCTVTLNKGAHWGEILSTDLGESSGTLPEYVEEIKKMEDSYVRDNLLHDLYIYRLKEQYND